MSSFISVPLSSTILRVLQTGKAVVRKRVCTDLSEPLLVAVKNQKSHVLAHIHIWASN